MMMMKMTIYPCSPGLVWPSHSQDGSAGLLGSHWKTEELKHQDEKDEDDIDDIIDYNVDDNDDGIDYNNYLNDNHDPAAGMEGNNG